MTHDELLARVSDLDMWISLGQVHKDDIYAMASTIRAVVELHKPTVQTKDGEPICGCAYGAWTVYPCPTIKAIQEQLK